MGFSSLKESPSSAPRGAFLLFYREEKKSPSRRGHDCLVNPNAEAWRNAYRRYRAIRDPTNRDPACGRLEVNGP